MAVVKVQDVVNKYVPKSVSEENINKDIEDAFRRLYQSIHDLRKFEKRLSETVSEADKADAMVLHGVELDNLEITPANAYRIVKFMRSCRLERRKIKEAQALWDTVMSKIRPEVKHLLSKERSVFRDFKAKSDYRADHNRITESPIFSDLKVISEDVTNNERV